MRSDAIQSDAMEGKLSYQGLQLCASWNATHSIKAATEAAGSWQPATNVHLARTMDRSLQIPSTSPCWCRDPESDSGRVCECHLSKLHRNCHRIRISHSHLLPGIECRKYNYGRRSLHDLLKRLPRKIPYQNLWMFRYSFVYKLGI